MNEPERPLQRILAVVVAEMEKLAEALDDRLWDAFVETEGRTAGQLLDHVAWAWDAEREAFAAIAGGARDSGWTLEWLDAQNGEQARASARRPRSEIQDRLHRSGCRAFEFVGSLTAEELGRSGTHMPGEPERTVAGWIEACLVGHPREHAAAIEALLRMPPYRAGERDESDDRGPTRPSRRGPSGECRVLRSAAE